MLVLFVLAVLLRCSGADLIRSTVTQWIWQTSIVVGDYLYVSGGEEYESPTSTSITNYIRNESLVVDLTRSWTNQTLTATSSFLSPSDLRTVRQPVLFYDKVNDVIKRYGGWPYLSEAMPSELWSFPVGVTNPAWTLETSPVTNGLSEGSQGPMSPAAAYSDTAFYSLGGNVLRRSMLPNQTVLSGVVRHDFTTGLWRNDTTDIPGQNNYRNMAKAFHVPNFGAEGFVAFVGGEAPPTEESFYEEGTYMVDMSVITLLDVASGTWYTQAATGDIPPPRVEFCAVGTTSADNSSYEIFVYGGSTNRTLDQIQADNEGYLNVYTLSLPAFQWFKSPSKTPVRRACHTCSVIGNRQMISIGGRFPSSRQPLGFDRDPWVGGVGVFDMTSFTWTDSYNASAEVYDSPKVVKDYYTSSYEVPDWSDTNLAAIFAFSPPAQSPDNTNNDDDNNTGTESGNGASQTSPSSPAPTGSSSTNVGAIAGGVVAGVAVMGIVAGLFIWRRRRQRQRLQSQPLHQQYTPTMQGGAIGHFDKHGMELSPSSIHDPNFPGYPQNQTWSELDTTPAKKHGQPQIGAVELPAAGHAR
ncbi:hypothetical protein PV10_04311 [Exophiala mesophila]|uniref:Kelch repeat protein n=1 Tax=Exophiala mesophila TaxID=212818 RepID=A0A0D1XXY2_EXOME|nr:uncharacterized protein PV10_04311 [Exophiala mesophila]KIV93066.1 hypothetical protein PV10_04311 [Exophiala mesophila]